MKTLMKGVKVTVKGIKVLDKKCQGHCDRISRAHIMKDVKD